LLEVRLPLHQSQRSPWLSNIYSGLSYDTHLISCTIHFSSCPKHHKRHAKSHPSIIPSRPVSQASRQPDIPKQDNQTEKEPNPNLPANASFLRHAKHPVHRASQAIPRALELIVHLFRQSSRISDLAADRIRQLQHVSNAIPNPYPRHRQLTSFNIRTFPLITPICSSFWLSSSSSTAFEYWPFLFGVAALNPPSPLPLPLSPCIPPLPG
jgi:hypothetical protein